MRTIRTLVIAVFTALIMLPTTAGAAELNCQAVKFIIPWGAGGGTDIIYRIVNQEAQKILGKDIVVVNIGGQGGNKGAKEALKARADGCTLFAGHDSMQTSYLSGRVDFNYFAFKPIALMTYTPSIVGAHKDVPHNSMKSLISALKKKPDSLLFGATLGSTSHFFPLEIQAATGAKFKYVHYDGTRQRMTALLSHNIDLGELNIISAQKYIQEGSLKALAIATEKRDSRLPDVPTLKEQGIDVVAGINRGIFTQKEVPDSIVKIYEDVYAKAVANAEVKASIEGKGSVIQYMNAKDYTAFLKKSERTLTKIAKDLGISK